MGIQYDKLVAKGRTEKSNGAKRGTPEVSNSRKELPPLCWLMKGGVNMVPEPEVGSVQWELEYSMEAIWREVGP